MPVFLIKLGLWWTGTAWPWVKGHWQWFAGAAAALLLFLLGRRSGKTVVVVDDQESDAAEAFKNKVEDEADAKVEELGEVRDATVVDARMDAVEAREEQLEELHAAADELTRDPARLNSHLKDIGRRQRQ